MAEEQSKGIQQIEGCEVIYDMGSGLVIAKVPLREAKSGPDYKLLYDQLIEKMLSR